MKHFNFLSIFLASLLMLVLFLWRSGCGNTSGTACDNSINNWDHFITKPEAQEYINALKARRELQPGKHSLDSSGIAVAELFVHARDMMRNMMLRDTCVGIRVYYGLKDNRIIPIICGVTAAENDIYWQRPSSTNAKAKSQAPASPVPTTQDGLLDMSKPEPPKNGGNGLH
jgi:hypothetical protein